MVVLISLMVDVFFLVHKLINLRNNPDTGSLDIHDISPEVFVEQDLGAIIGQGGPADEGDSRGLFGLNEEAVIGVLIVHHPQASVC